ncbi:protein transport protein SFT2-like isoform X2 [Mangifera indica]|uniref:protein transport protein SFT2-like isoform X2 n=1 Tax=Mangifera indica TaxID=29780 RepID=UPI001CFBB1E2|nr:protein transport protein SFT2-like isoform X2 [Mangifera indica]XP_044481440.1 protein transport protein SFT2-like isoform X2 [Mangifera indica]
MQKMAQGWFSGGGSSEDQLQNTSTPSLLADWNSYEASRDADESSGSAFGFDLEAAVRSANESVSGTFNVVSKGVRDLPGNLQSATIMVLMPQKFAICFTLGCGFIIGSFFALRGPKNQLAHMTSRERLPLTLGFIGSMVGTIYVSMVLHSYVLSVLFSVIQVLALGYYAISYFPGGSAGMKFLSSALTSSVMRCFGR